MVTAVDLLTPQNTCAKDVFDMALDIVANQNIERIYSNASGVDLRGCHITEL
jgi:hypothetical protein